MMKVKKKKKKEQTLLTFLPVLTHSHSRRPRPSLSPHLSSDKTKHIQVSAVSFYEHVPLESAFIGIIWLTAGPVGRNNRPTGLLRNHINHMYMVLRGFQNVSFSKSHDNAPF